MQSRNPPPTVSVIMTVFNGQAYLEAAIDSILRQTYADLEFIVVDDGSTDTTPEILAEAARDKRISVISPGRIGRARALNVAWRHSRGQYVANLDADDQAEPERLAAQVAFLTEHPTVGLLATACRYIYEGYDQAYESRLNHPPAQPATTDEALRAGLVRRNPFVHSSIMMPRFILEQAGGYNEACPISIDYDLWVRIAARARLACLAEPLTVRLLRRESYFHRQVPLWSRWQHQVRIRWLAWRQFERPVSDLRFVFIEPTVRTLYGWLKQKRRAESRLFKAPVSQGDV